MEKKNEVASPAIGQLIDELFGLRKESAALKAKAKLIDEREELLEQQVLHALGDAKIDGAKGKKATATIVHRMFAEIKDWNKLTKWVVKTKRTDIFQRRIKLETYREFLDMKKPVPGLLPGSTTSITLTAKK